ncbi:MAG: DUF1428 domain-containing protein [Proteobacteria bacterium]|nr:DUF1428 domain-containing protein [Pseudomonadota bacterium]
MTYVDGFVVPVPKKNLAAYKKMATVVGKIWMEYGALSYVECVADDVKPGKWTSFPQSVKLKKNEVVVFAWVTYKSRKARDTVMAKSIKDKRFATFMKSRKLPFDGKRMIFGGFKQMIGMRP